MSELGLIERINREIMHPLGLAISRNPKTGMSEHIFVADDGFFEYGNIESTVISDEEVIQNLKVTLSNHTEIKMYFSGYQPKRTLTNLDPPGDD